MFSFHKPKVYRSPQGCCICKAKSSSSRFTDSKKYESDFNECFQLIEPRQGEICNACVLLVKRFKRLPLGNRRHWSHVSSAVVVQNMFRNVVLNCFFLHLNSLFVNVNNNFNLLLYCLFSNRWSMLVLDPESNR